jgi:hypothetical protein
MFSLKLNFTILLLLILQQSLTIDNTLRFLEEEIYDELNDIKLPIEQICKNKNYPFHSYEATTEDGYILKLFRIPGPKNSKLDSINQSKKVILLQHGLFVTIIFILGF